VFAGLALSSPARPRSGRRPARGADSFPSLRGLGPPPTARQHPGARRL